jgi:uncharacterized protein YggU (UPF0235/DUF167 family)
MIKARVRAAPEKGEANAALVQLLAKSLHVSRSSVSIASGETARIKKIFVAGDPARLTETLAERLAPAIPNE